MKTSNTSTPSLYPPLDSIEARLFSPSDSLLYRWVHARDQVPPEIASELDNHPLAGEYRRILLSDVESDAIPTDAPPVIVPAWLMERIDQSLAVKQARYAPGPTPGRILAMNALPRPDGKPERDLNTPLAILLDQEVQPGVWYGWAVAPDPDYASEWDVLLQRPDDEPFDPSAGVIQTWNPVYCYLPAGHEWPVLAELRPERLAGVRALALAFAVGTASADAPSASPGRVWVRWEGVGEAGEPITTGTPLGDDKDSRHAYQALYHRAAEAVREPARVAMMPQPTLAERLIQHLFDLAQSAGRLLQPAPVLAHAMGSEATEAIHLVLEGGLRLAIEEFSDQEDSGLELELRAEAGHWVVERYALEHLQERLELHPDEPSQRIYLDARTTWHLRVSRTDVDPPWHLDLAMPSLDRDP
ncbi:MAG: hypothetical protein WCP34_17560 [Pseudomonadota bacterium]